MNDARTIVKELFEVGDDYEVLYLGGGASMQFAMIPYNFLRDNGTAAYDTVFGPAKLLRKLK